VDLSTVEVRLGRAQIAAAGIEIADRDGIDAVTMRRVATALGAGTMSLYRHVAGRAELLDTMVDAVYARIELPAEPSGDWRQDITLLARAQRRIMRAHAWVAPLVGSRPPILASFLRTFEWSLRAFEQARLEITEAAAAGTTINAFVTGFALLEHAEQAAGRRTGLTRDEWRRRNWPRVERSLAGGAYPTVARFVEHGQDADPDAAFEAGLRHLLDGVDRARRRGTSARGRRH
jgi:AcrR family transcriptional regulator